LRTDIADARDDDAAAVCRVIVIVIVEVGADAPEPVPPALDPLVPLEGATWAPPEQPAIAINAATAAKRSVLN
jgi:hypothetical protein